MSNGTSAGTPAGWYPDPADATKLRWWAGTAWTGQVADRPAIIPSPPTEHQYLGQTQLPQRRGWTPAVLSTHETRRGSQTASSWLLATSILWVGIPSGFIAQFVATAYPLLASLASLVVIVLITFGLGRLDGNRLEAQSYRAPSVAWAALLPPVYFILRTARVGPGGIAVLLAYLASVVIYFEILFNNDQFQQLLSAFQKLISVLQ